MSRASNYHLYTTRRVFDNIRVYHRLNHVVHFTLQLGVHFFYLCVIEYHVCCCVYNGADLSLFNRFIISNFGYLGWLLVLYAGQIGLLANLSLLSVAL